MEGWDRPRESTEVAQGGWSKANPAVRGAEKAPACLHLCSLSMVLTHPVPSLLFSFRGTRHPEYLLPTPCPRKKGEGPEPGEGEELEENEEPRAAGKGGAKVPSSNSHSLGIWMSRQGLHRRRGHKYRSATAIFPAALARHSRPDSAQAPFQREGGWWAAWGGGTGRGEEGRERWGRKGNGRLLVTNIWASPGSWPRPQPRLPLAVLPSLPFPQLLKRLSTGWASQLLSIPFLLSVFDFPINCLSSTNLLPQSAPPGTPQATLWMLFPCVTPNVPTSRCLWACVWMWICM